MNCKPWKTHFISVSVQLQTWKSSFTPLSTIISLFFTRSHFPSRVWGPDWPAASEAGGCAGHGFRSDHGLPLLTLSSHIQGQVGVHGSLSWSWSGSLLRPWAAPSHTQLTYSGAGRSSWVTITIMVMVSAQTMGCPFSNSAHIFRGRLEFIGHCHSHGHGLCSDHGLPLLTLSSHIQGQVGVHGSLSWSWSWSLLRPWAASSHTQLTYSGAGGRSWVTIMVMHGLCSDHGLPLLTLSSHIQGQVGVHGSLSWSCMVSAQTMGCLFSHSAHIFRGR